MTFCASKYVTHSCKNAIKGILSFLRKVYVSTAKVHTSAFENFKKCGVLFMMVMVMMMMLMIILRQIRNTKIYNNDDI